MIKGKNLVLRALELEDVDILYNWENDQMLWHLSNVITPFSRFALEQYVLNAGQDIFATRQLRLMIDKLVDNKLSTIGLIDLFDFDPHNKHAGIGIFIVKDERKKGYASEALQMLIDYSFNTLHLHQLYCNITSENKASLKLFEKHHFQMIGNKKEWLNIQNKWADEYILQLINN